jgi:hypothetical protein
MEKMGLLFLAHWTEQIFNFVGKNMILQRLQEHIFLATDTRNGKY